MNRIHTSPLLLCALVLAACSRTPDPGPTQPVIAAAAAPAAAVTAGANPVLPGKMLNQKMAWPGYNDLRCVPAPAHYDSMATKRFETIERSSDTLEWETIGRYPQDASTSAIRHVAAFKIIPGAVGDMRLVRDDSPRESYAGSRRVNFPLSASAINNFTLVSYLNEVGKQEAHFTFDVTLVNKQGAEKTATYNCVSDDYETVEDYNARRIAEAAQKQRARQMESVMKAQQAGGMCDAIAADMEAAMNAQDDVRFAGRHEAAIYYGCLR